MNQYSRVERTVPAVTRKEREYFARRAEILRAAERVFAAKGFTHTTMSGIAEAAEFGTGTLYKYFKSKEELYFTLIDEKGEEIHDLVMAELGRKGSAKEKIKDVLRLQFEFVEKNRDFFRIYTSERSRFEWSIKDDLGKKTHHRFVGYIQSLARVLQEGIEEGEFKPLDSLDMAHALVGMTNSFVFEWLISPEVYPLFSKVDTVLEIFLTGTERTEKAKDQSKVKNEKCKVENLK